MLLKGAKYFLLKTLIIFSLITHASPIDSLILLLKNTKSNSVKIDILNTLSSEYKNKADTSLYFANKALVLSKKTNNYPQIVNSYLSLSNTYQDVGDYNSSLNALYKAQAIADSINNNDLLGKINNNLGNAYRGISDITKAEECYDAAITAYKLTNNELELAKTYNNIGLIYVRQDKLYEAILMYEKSIEVAKKYDDKKAISNGYSNLGVAHYYKGEIDKTILYFEKSLNIDLALNNKLGVAISFSNIGELYIETGEVDKALEQLMKSVEYAKEINAQDLLKHTYLIISQAYEKKNNHLSALEYYQYHAALKDSLVGIEKSKYALELETKYETSEKEKKILKLEKQKAKQELEITEKKSTQNLLIGSVLIVALLLIIFVNGYNTKRKANKVLKIYSSEIEEKNAEITDSIRYAKRIQAAILPPNNLFKQYLKESFIIYKPKDIVAGDFYWMETINSPQEENIILFAVADCTGHGVPGAMVSVICNNALNRSVREHGLIEPGLILDKSREIVIQEFEKSDEEVSDGMDIALCSLKLQTTNSKQQTTTATLQYAGAHNPLWVIRPVHHNEERSNLSNEEDILLENHLSLTTDNYLLYEIKANKQPIGKSQAPKGFKTHSVKLKSGDLVYLFSDGYVDQFGGEKGKKFKTSQFKKMLISICNEPMAKQQQIIEESFNSWKGSLEQVDDVCVLGVKIT